MCCTTLRVLYTKTRTMASAAGAFLHLLKDLIRKKLCRPILAFENPRARPYHHGAEPHNNTGPDRLMAPCRRLVTTIRIIVTNPP